MITGFFRTRRQSFDLDLVFLLMRIVFGCAFILHGWGKVHAPFQWMGAGSSVPGVFQALAALAEFGGGIAMILGLLTRLAAFGMVCNMIVATAFLRFVFHSSFVSNSGIGVELPAIYLTVALLFFVQGPGRFSLDRRIFGVKS